jgi:nucleoside-diphosphate-sugar epimerase
VINISTGIAPSMREVARLVVNLTDADPTLVRYSKSAPASGAPHLCCSPELAGRLLGWRAETALANGLARTVRWYREQIKAAILRSLQNALRVVSEQRI